MRKLSITRMELLTRQSQLQLARQGRELLNQKRGALIKEFMRMADVVLESSQELDRQSTTAYRQLGQARAIAGAEGVHSAALAGCHELPLQVSSRSIMGVSVPVIEQIRVARSPLMRDYGVVGTSVFIDETAMAFEELVNIAIELAEYELNLSRLASELRRISGRINALDNVLIPRLESECKMISTALSERERGDHYRLKLVKRLMKDQQIG